jgi:hypothetical protein
MVEAVRTTGWRPALPMKWQVHLPTLDKTPTALGLLVDKWSSAMTKGEKVVAAVTTVGPIWFRPTIPHRSIAGAIAVAGYGVFPSSHGPTSALRTGRSAGFEGPPQRPTPETDESLDEETDTWLAR